MNDSTTSGHIPPKPAQESTVHVRHGDVILCLGDKNAFTYTIKDPVGIHARPAGALVTLAKQFKSEISFSADGKSVQADSIISLMSLGAKKGTRLKVEAHGEDERETLCALHTFLREHL